MLDMTTDSKSATDSKSPTTVTVKKPAPPKKSPTNSKTERFNTPPIIIYSDGFPADLSFAKRGKQQFTGIWIPAKIYIPEIKGYNSIGRILNQRGISSRPAETEILENPPLVIYSNGLPKDVGFGRGDQQQQSTGVWLSAKIYIPEVEGYNFIGRILGPRGISVRRLEAETECKILIRGRGSIKDEKREQYLLSRNGGGWAHLNDKLHVLLLAHDESDEKRCRNRLKSAIQVIQGLLVPTYDQWKKNQLIQLSVLNGTYRPTPPRTSAKNSMP